MPETWKSHWGLTDTEDGHSVEKLHSISLRLLCVCMQKHDITLRLIDQHHTAQQRGEWQSEEGGVWVAVTSQELQQEHEDWR